MGVCRITMTSGERGDITLREIVNQWSTALGLRVMLVMYAMSSRGEFQGRFFARTQRRGKLDRATRQGWARRF